MPDRIRLIAPQHEEITSSLSLTAKWIRTFEELVKADFDSWGTSLHLRTVEELVNNVPTFRGLQLDQDPNTKPKNYTDGSNTVPIMSGYTNGPVTISDSGFMGAGYEGWRALDGDSNTRWHVNATGGMLTIDLGSVKKINTYAIRARNDEYLISSPKDWTFEGSQDGTSWTVLDIVAGDISWATNQLKSYTLDYDKVGLYRYYRLNVTSNQSGIDLSFSELQLLEAIGHDFDYYTTGDRIVGPIDLSGVALGDEYIRWELGVMPEGTTVTISTALTDTIDPPLAWVTATNSGQNPAITLGDHVTGKYLWIKQTLSTTNITKTPALMLMETQLVFDAVADTTIEIDRTSKFSGANYRVTTVSALPCGEPTTFFPQDVYDGFLCWRARAVNAALGIDTGWSQVNTFNLTGGPFSIPRYMTLVKNTAFGRKPNGKTLDIKKNTAFGKPRAKRALYQVENRAFGKLRATRALYAPLSVTDDPPLPWIDNISVQRGPVGSILTLTGSGFGYTHTAIDLANVNRSLRCYGGFVTIGEKLCSVLEWNWTTIKFQLPSDAQTGGIRVKLTAPTEQVSNQVGFEVYAGIPTNDVGIELFLCDRDNPNLIVRQIDGAWDKSFQVLQNNPGSGSFKISRNDPVGGNKAYLGDDSLILVKLDGNPLFKWIVENKSPNYVDSGEQQVISVSGRGVLAMLSWAVVYPESMEAYGLDRHFTGTASSILRALVLEARARGGLVGVEVDWEDDQDSIGNVFTEQVNLSFHVGTPILEVARRFSEGLGYFDIEMTSNLVLKIYKNRGLDVSDRIIYRPGQAIMSHQNQSNASKIVNEVLVEGKDKRLAIAAHSDSQLTFGRREGYLSASSIDSGLGEYGEAYLRRAAFPMWGIQGTITQFYDEAGNRLKPFESYIIGDWIGWNIPPEGYDQEGFNEKLRVQGITVSEQDDTGALDYTLELHSAMLDHEIRLNQKVERLAQYSGSDVLSSPASSSEGYSVSEVDEFLLNKANTIHSHGFLDLVDAPDSYAEQAGKALAVNAQGTGLEFYDKDGLPVIVVNASKSIGPEDVATLQRCDSAAALTITIPGAETIKVGAEIVFVRYGASNVNFVAEAGRTLRSLQSYKFISGVYGAVTLKKMTADTWLLIGSLSEAGL